MNFYYRSAYYLWGQEKKEILIYGKKETRNKDGHLTNRDTHKAKQFNTFFTLVFNNNDGLSIALAKTN